MKETTSPTIKDMDLLILQNWDYLTETEKELMMSIGLEPEKELS